MEKASRVVYWFARILAAIILVQTLYFKFSGSEESVYIFTSVGMEPWGRIGVGIMELAAAILLLLNATAWLGGSLAFGLMVGAIGMHFTMLGISVQGDGGYLFSLAVTVALCSAFIMFRARDKIFSLLQYFKKEKSLTPGH
jgi:putative oxidoreductase